MEISKGDTVKGIVKFFKKNSGWGYIVPLTEKENTENKNDIFYHSSNIENDSQTGDKIILFSGDEVDFEVAVTHKGPQAIKIIRTKMAARTNAEIKNRNIIPATNVAIWLKKSYLSTLASLMRDFNNPGNMKNLNQQEIEAVGEFSRSLDSAEKLLVSYSEHIHDKKNHDVSKNGIHKKKSNVAITDFTL